METPQTHSPETTNDDEAIVAAARETTRQVGAVAERAAYVLDQTGAVMTPAELADAQQRRTENIRA